MINPTIVEGQVMGGIAQGFGGALYERIEYDREGNPTQRQLRRFPRPLRDRNPERRGRSISRRRRRSIRSASRASARPAASRSAPSIASAIEDALAAARRRQVPPHADHAEHDPRGARRRPEAASGCAGNGATVAVVRSPALN